MTKRLALLVLAPLCLVNPTVARAQSLVATWEDGATIQLVVMPDGTSPVNAPEPLSGGFAATYMGSEANQTFWRVIDLRFQSRSWTVAREFQACGYVQVMIGGWPNPNSPYFGAEGGAGPPCTDTNGIVIQGTLLNAPYEGSLALDGAFTGTVNDPGEVPNLTSSNSWVVFGPNQFGPLGYATIQGTLRVEVSDYPATVVKLRQGIPGTTPFPKPFKEPWSDGNPPWEDDIYDTSTHKDSSGNLENRIYNLGCALTLLSMALESAGALNVPVPVDPDNCAPNTVAPNDPCSLNTFMKHNNGYEGDIVDWVTTTSNLSNALGKPLQFVYDDPVVGNTDAVDSNTDPDKAEKFLEQAVIVHGVPVVVGVETCKVNGQSTFPCHYVVVWGHRNGEWLIADPIPGGGGNNLTLAAYGGHYITRGYVIDPQDLSGLDVATASNIELTLTSPTGAQAGFSGAVERIPDSAYFVDTLLEDSDGASSVGPSRFVVVSQPGDGQYTLAITGLAPGVYSTDIHTYSQDGSMQPTLTVTGIAGAGSTSNFDVQLTTAPGGASAVVRSATPASALNDLNNSLSLGLIKNRLIALCLSILLHNAERAQARGNCWESRDILRLFMAEVKAVEGKAIAPQAAQVLLEDAAYLIAHCGR